MSINPYIVFFFPNTQHGTTRPSRLQHCAGTTRKNRKTERGKRGGIQVRSSAKSQRHYSLVKGNLRLQFSPLTEKSQSLSPIMVTFHRGTTESLVTSALQCGIGTWGIFPKMKECQVVPTNFMYKSSSWDILPLDRSGFLASNFSHFVFNQLLNCQSLASSLQLLIFVLDFKPHLEAAAVCLYNIKSTGVSMSSDSK